MIPDYMCKECLHNIDTWVHVRTYTLLKKTIITITHAWHACAVHESTTSPVGTHEPRLRGQGPLTETHASIVHEKNHIKSTTSHVGTYKQFMNPDYVGKDLYQKHMHA
jgi:hypothetical protein